MVLVTVTGPDGGVIDESEFFGEEEARDHACEVVEEAGGDADDSDEDD